MSPCILSPKTRYDRRWLLIFLLHWSTATHWTYWGLLLAAPQFPPTRREYPQAAIFGITLTGKHTRCKSVPLLSKFSRRTAPFVYNHLTCCISVFGEGIYWLSLLRIAEIWNKYLKLRSFLKSPIGFWVLLLRCSICRLQCSSFYQREFRTTLRC